MGDVNGVGPEILAKALAHRELRERCSLLVIGSLHAYENARALAPGAPGAKKAAVPATETSPGALIPVFDAGTGDPPLCPGQLEVEASRCAVEWIRTATRLAIDGAVDAVVTCPINKEGIQLAGCPSTGHTEIIAEMTHSPGYRMCLFTERMRIVHISAHFPLSEAIALVRRTRIEDSIRIAHAALTRLGLSRRRIAVAGLNPHAGESGLLGMEEGEEIAPAVEACIAEGIDCSGPYPPDTVFRRMYEGEFDLVVAMYHDQGHIPLKLIAMDEGVNVTLGIPIVRTSVDHGTAYDIAGKGIAREHSLCSAIRLAVALAEAR
ncbi:MAG: 4-hydroxythreonine-4-phosphate dehydrogenase PdxA [Candidatus Hydrogenedentes bacterium]|nr:4-hydroxythreonine-4-phosphate dehydrogenase PdxA [Candidatus Hydrogenedentota bacterium]